MVHLETGRQEQASTFLIGEASIVRECLAKCLTEAWSEPVKTCTSLEECLNALPARVATLVVLQKPGQPMAEALAQISAAIRRAPDVPVILIGNFDAPSIFAAIEHGVKGFVPFDMPWELAIEAMRFVRAGGTFAPVQCLLGMPNSQTTASDTLHAVLGDTRRHEPGLNGAVKFPRQSDLGAAGVLRAAASRTGDRTLASDPARTADNASSQSRRPRSATAASDTTASAAAVQPTGGSRAPSGEPSEVTALTEGCDLTARQAAVVEALRRGKANKAIAYELSMQESTVKVHVRNIMKKLRARNRTEVAFIVNRLLNRGNAPADATKRASAP